MPSGFAVAQGEPESGTLSGMLRLGIGVSHGAPFVSADVSIVSAGCQQYARKNSVEPRKKQGQRIRQAAEKEELSV
jgi:hypothetical protein